MASGEQQAWEILSELNPGDVCGRARAAFDESSGAYVLKSFRQHIFISTKSKEITGHSPESKFLLDDLDYYSRLSILWYLITASDTPLSGKLIKPADLRGGQIYLRGTHVLPLDRIAEKYGSDILQFARRGRQFGGKELDYGDASMRLLPFPRVPVFILLWKSDEEFSSRSSLLLDSSCESQLPADVIWSTAMMSLLVMLRPLSLR